MRSLAFLFLFVSSVAWSADPYEAYEALETAKSEQTSVVSAIEHTSTDIASAELDLGSTLGVYLLWIYPVFGPDELIESKITFADHQLNDATESVVNAEAFGDKEDDPGEDPASAADEAIRDSATHYNFQEWAECLADANLALQYLGWAWDWLSDADTHIGASAGALYEAQQLMDEKMGFGL